MYNWFLRHRNSIASNIINPSTFTQGFNVGLDGVFTSDSNYAVSDFIRVAALTNYDGFSDNGNGSTNVFFKVLFYDEQKRFLEGETLEEPGVGILDSFTSPAASVGAKFLRVVMRSLSYGAILEGAGLVLAGGPLITYNVDKQVYPIYNSMDRIYKRPNGGRFYEDTLKSPVKLIARDYDYLATVDFREKIEVIVVDTQGVHGDFRGKFYKTDCSFDDDNRAVSVKIEPDSNYARILAGLNKNFSIKDKGLELEEVKITKRPIQQMYMGGSAAIMNIQGQSFWEEPVSPTHSWLDLITSYAFDPHSDFHYIHASYAAGLSIDVTGVYDVIPFAVNNPYRRRTDSIYELRFRYTGGPDHETRGEIMRVSDSLSLYVTDPFPGDPPGGGLSLVHNIFAGWQLEFHGVAGNATGSFFLTSYFTYSRYLTDKDLFDGLASSPMNGFGELNPSFPRVRPKARGLNQISEVLSDKPTDFRKVLGDTPDAAKYHAEHVPAPYDAYNKVTPIGKDVWRNGYSLWQVSGYALEKYEISEASLVEFRNCFSLKSLLNLLMREIGVNVSFDNTTAYSEFLYAATNPIGSFDRDDVDELTTPTEITENNLDYYFLSKDNLKNGELEKESSLTKVNLDYVFKALKIMYGLEWYLEDDKLRIEHVSWYQKGGDYTTDIIGTDLTLLKNSRINKNWGFGQNKWSFDKSNMPERYEFSFMDGASRIFVGESIQLITDFADPGNIINNKVGLLNPDVDFVVGRNSEISDDGLVLLNTYTDGPDKIVPFVQITKANGSVIIVHNGFNSFWYLHDKYYFTDLPSSLVNLNSEEIDLSDNVSREKVQKLRYPHVGIVSLFNLVRTALGVGEIDSLSVNLESNIAEVTIKHETE